MANIADLFRSIIKYPSGNEVFNPWADVDRQNDSGSSAPKIRKNQLTHYLRVRMKSARYGLIGEALSYQGGHFTGIPMTSERILLGYQAHRRIYPQHVLPDLEPRRTSRPEVILHGFTEPTATIVWGMITQSGLGPSAFVFWNAFPWHPFDAGGGILSNRRPTKEEVTRGLKPMKIFLELFPGIKFIALGKVAAHSLDVLNREFCPIRHPARGGAGEFRRQFLKFIKA